MSFQIKKFINKENINLGISEVYQDDLNEKIDIAFDALDKNIISEKELKKILRISINIYAKNYINIYSNSVPEMKKK